MFAPALRCSRTPAKSKTKKKTNHLDEDFLPDDHKPKRKYKGGASLFAEPERIHPKRQCTLKTVCYTVPEIFKKAEDLEKEETKEKEKEKEGGEEKVWVDSHSCEMKPSMEGESRYVYLGSLSFCLWNVPFFFALRSPSLSFVLYEMCLSFIHRQQIGRYPKGRSRKGSGRQKIQN